MQANAYVTPPQNQGFSAHYDVHDVFVLQIDGEKQWRIHSPVLMSPLRDQPWNDRRADVEKRAEEQPDGGRAEAGRLPLPPSRIPPRRDGARWCEHPPDSRHPCLDAVCARTATRGAGLADRCRRSSDPHLPGARSRRVRPERVASGLRCGRCDTGGRRQAFSIDQMSESLLQQARLNQRAAPISLSSSLAMPTRSASTRVSCFAAIWPHLLITADRALWCEVAQVSSW